MNFVTNPNYDLELMKLNEVQRDEVVMSMDCNVFET
jgi:hypothetical protein